MKMPFPDDKLDPSPSMTQPSTTSLLRTQRASLKIIPSSQCPPAEHDDGTSTRQSNSEGSGHEERRVLEMRSQIRAELAQPRPRAPYAPPATEPVPSPPKRRVGKVRYCFGGRFLFGPDMRLASVAILMIVIPSIIYDGWSLPWMVDHWKGGWLLAIFAVLLEIVVLGLFLRTALSDPGIVPREADLSGAGTGGWYDQILPRNPPKHQDVVIHGHLFKMKYCLSCKFYRPPRCVHCSTCDNCVDKFDHHCPWVGNCVGRRNYRSFILFISTTSIFILLVLSTCPIKFTQCFQERHRQNVDENGDGEGMRNVWLTAWDSVVLTLFCVGILWFVLGLAGYHFFLITSNQTTYEQIKGFYEEKMNPWDRGLRRNLRELLCRRRRPKFTFRPRGSIIYADMAPISACPGSGRVESGGIVRRSIQLLRRQGGEQLLAPSLSLKSMHTPDRESAVDHPPLPPRLRGVVYHAAERPNSVGSFVSADTPVREVDHEESGAGRGFIIGRGGGAVGGGGGGDDDDDDEPPTATPGSQGCVGCGSDGDCVCTRRLVANDIFYRRRSNTDEVIIGKSCVETEPGCMFAELDRPSSRDATILSWLRKAGEFGRLMSKTDLGRWTCVLPED